MNRNPTLLQAIEEVLRQNHQALSASQIYQELVSNGFNFSKFRTPETAIRARLSEDINRVLGDPTFVRPLRGRYTVKDNPNLLLSNNRSFFLVIEGLDGSGKTAVAHRLAKSLAQTYPGKVMFTYEPHDPSSAGYFIRQVLRKERQTVSAEVLALAFATNRADHYGRLIEPYLTEDLIEGDTRICICDRYYLSSLVYQSSSEDDFNKILALNFAAEQPDLTIFLNASTSTCYHRMKLRQEDKELFEKNLHLSRERYFKAIEFLRNTRNEKIVEVNADKDLQEVIEEIGKILTGPKGADWMVFQSQLPIDEPTDDSFSIDDNFTLFALSRAFSSKWNSILSYNESSILEAVDLLVKEVTEAVNQFSYHSISALYLDILSRFGYDVLPRLPWTDIDAVKLEYKLPYIPNGILLSGVALVLGSLHSQPILTKKILDELRYYDFVQILDLRATQLVKSYNRDPLIEGDKLITPATSPLTREDISNLILVTALNVCWNELGECMHFYRDKVTRIIEAYKWNALWHYANHLKLNTLLLKQSQVARS